MIPTTTQSNNHIGGDGEIIGRDKNVTINNPVRRTRLSILFDKLEKAFNENSHVTEVSADLQRYANLRDTIGLEQKLKDGGREDLYEDALWLKEEYHKKLTKFQFFEPAQEIHSFLLALVLSKFRNIIFPLICASKSEQEVSLAIENEIVAPIVSIIQEEGCSDVMGLSSVDIEGMIYYLTGQCHIKWCKK
ncbi:hypothetical protein KTO58_19290 [Chitinophaga pendula]|uniref:ABC-three component system protein n=1 Tax=Chitinophaga TaxID=79328 RepID=UPI000BAE9E99|nr:MULTISPECIES: ABC-three component system protein [Chitinophaga]ASZ11184.1 hypothetical protein CK934_09520 [Chitinophaga sp. MD30]UCJ05820.1 hypothetical protein KTO58_19290 [Chitinophaga pendula]